MVYGWHSRALVTFVLRNTCKLALNQLEDEATSYFTSVATLRSKVSPLNALGGGFRFNIFVYEMETKFGVHMQENL